jgi:hypothetical protein
MKKIKKFLAALLIATSIGQVAPAPRAEAGIILLPIIIGYWIILRGIETNNLAMVLLGKDGNLQQESLEKVLFDQYPFIEDRDVVRSIAMSIREKAMNAPVVDGKKIVTLSRGEVLSLLAPTGLPELQPQAVEKMIQDLQ